MKMGGLTRVSISVIWHFQDSLDGKGRTLDNIFTERLWRSVKYEEVFLYDYVSPKEARQGLTRYMDFYNYERPHQSLNYHTPAEMYYNQVKLQDTLIN